MEVCSSTDLALDSDGPVKDAMHAKDGRLGSIDDRGTHEGAKHTPIAHSERAPIHVLNGQVA